MQTAFKSKCVRLCTKDLRFGSQEESPVIYKYDVCGVYKILMKLSDPKIIKQY